MSGRLHPLCDRAYVAALLGLEPERLTLSNPSRWLVRYEVDGRVLDVWSMRPSAELTVRAWRAVI